jgi:SAM-dependent methyltransferase
MAAMDVPPASFDLIWCEGAAYLLGVPRALRQWRPLLRPGGRIALTEAVWLAPNPSAAARANFQDYPAMTDVAGTRAHFREAGYELLGDFVLPADAWWNYYAPLEARVANLQDVMAGDPDSLAVWREVRDEIDCYRRHGDDFGYAFFVAA